MKIDHIAGLCLSNQKAASNNAPAGKNKRGYKQAGMTLKKTCYVLRKRKY